MTDRLPRRAALTLGLTGLGLAGCGFRPVYMPTASGKAGVAERELAATDIAIIGERPGQLLRQALQDRFNSDGGGRHRYSLAVTYYISGEAVGIQQDNSASRIKLVGTANWALSARDAERTRLTQGSARTNDGYNLFAEQYFAGTLGNEAAQRRMAEELADQIATQLAVWFRERAEPKAG